MFVPASHANNNCWTVNEAFTLCVLMSLEGGLWDGGRVRTMTVKSRLSKSIMSKLYCPRATAFAMICITSFECPCTFNLLLILSSV